MGTPREVSRSSCTKAVGNGPARQELEPLRKGERPTAVTIGTITAATIAIGNASVWLLGVRELGGSKVSIAAVLPLSALLLALAVGMWNMRIGAIALFQACLAATLVVMSLTLLLQAGPVAAPPLAATIAGGSALLWFLARAVARARASIDLDD